MAYIQRSSMLRISCLGLLVLLALPACKKGTPSNTSGSTASSPAPFEDGWPGMPVPGEAPGFSVPAAEQFTLSNGIPVTAIQRGSIPLVHLRLNIYSGSSADPVGKEGLAVFTADMMNEATASRGALEISDDLQRMASSVSLSAGLSSSSLSINCLEDKFAATLAIARDILENPSFPDAEIDRVRGDRKNRLLTQRDNPGTINYAVFAKLLYGDHYAGRPTAGSASSLDAIGRADMVSWHKSAWTPSNAGLVVVSRLPAADVQAALELGLGSWARSEAAPPVSPLVTPEPTRGVQVYWVDRPGASQSYIQVGSVSPAFNAEKHQAWSLGNMVLGGQFSSRLNLNLREDKGYTYGARTSVWDGPHGGMFRARSSVRTATTGPSLFEFFKELTDIVGSRPITQDEFDAVVSRSEQGYPGRFENMGSVLGIFAGADAQRRPAGWLSGHSGRVSEVSLEGAQAAIAQLVDPANLVVVIVGDWNAVVESPERADGSPRPITVTVGDHVRGLNLGDVVFLDEDGLATDEPAR